MRGHVRKRGQNWSFVIEAGSDPVTGKRRQKWHSGYRTRAQAETALNETLHRMQTGSYVEPLRLTVASHMRSWLDTHTLSLRPSTADSYRTNFRLHIEPHLGSIRLQQLNVTHLNDLYTQLSRPKTDGGSGLAPKTVHYVHSIIHKSLEDAVRASLLPRNVAAFASPPKQRVGERERRVWTIADVKRFLSFTEHHTRLHPLFHVALMTGMRRGELLGLRWEDVDFDHSELAVRRAIVSVRNKVTMSAPKTAKGKRVISLDARTVAVLRAHLTQQAEERQAVGSNYEDQGLVFADFDGTILHPDRLSQHFRRQVEIGRLPKISFHDLRHTHATLALKAGVHPKIVSERLGHASVTLTLDLYSHAIPSLQADAATLIGDLLDDD